MPYCACFHEYSRETDAIGRPIDVEDAGDLLSRIPELSTASCSQEFLALLQKRIVIGLFPQIDECYALGPYKVRGAGALSEARYGALLTRAKYWLASDEQRKAQQTITEELVFFTSRHPRFRSVEAVVAPPSSRSPTESLPLAWAREIASRLGARTIEAGWKTPPQGTQKNGDGNVWDNIRISEELPRSVLVIDDALDSGDTMREVGKALRNAGAQQVYGLCVAKTMKGIQYNSDGSYGIDLSEERWR